MGNIRKLRRSVAKHPLNFWRATQKAKKQNENQSKQEETQTPQDRSGIGNDVSGVQAGQVDPVVAGKENGVGEARV
jgi:hypothetical protein